MVNHFAGCDIQPYRLYARFAFRYQPVQYEDNMSVNGCTERLAKHDFTRVVPPDRSDLKLGAIAFNIGDTMPVMNTYQALRILNVDTESSQEEIRSAYRKMALELHPDKRNGDDNEFKKVTEAYNHLKKSRHGTDDNNNNSANYTRENRTREKPRTANRAQWGAGPQDGTVPEQDWGKFTKSVEDEDPSFWREYEKKFWEDYNARVTSRGNNGEYAKAAEPEKQPDVFVKVDKSRCIGCCSCEIIAPDVFEINKESMLNPKSSVINPKGAGINKIMNAAQTCPTKAIIVDNPETKERLFPY